MTRLFTSTAEGWEIRLLDGDRYCLRPVPGGLVQAVPDEGEMEGGDALLLRLRAGSDVAGSGWAVVAHSDVRVVLNGEPVVVGVAVLRDRDEMRIGVSEPAYLSMERLAAVEPCERDDAPRCPRCANPIERGELSVGCPGCGVRHHQRADRECWTYLPTCAMCDQPTDLAAGLRWTPEEP
jgi:hypothetical protein